MIAALADRAVVFGLVAAVGFGAGWLINGWRLGEGIAQAQVDTVTVVRVVERSQQGVADAEGNRGHAELEEARRTADAARATAAGLRGEAGRLATRLAACAAGTAAEREARERAAGVLADVLGEMAAEGAAVAAAADRARAAGGTCQRTYDGVKAAQAPQ